MNPDNISIELKQYSYFCVWKSLTKPGRDRPDKIPYNPLTDQRAKSNDPNTFAPFDVAKKALDGKADYSGIGVGLFGKLGAIDIDNCIDPAGQINEIAHNVISAMGTYTEKSPSGDGLRLFFFVPDFKYDKDRYYIKNSSIGLEVYVVGVTKRFVTVTGDVYGFPMSIADCSTTLPLVLEKYMLRSKAVNTDNSSAEVLVVQSILTDEQVVEKIHKEADQKFAGLYDSGDWQSLHYPSQSEADQALCNKLAFYCGRDKEQINRLFTNSGLYREKWEEREDYRAATLEKAVRGCSVIYDPASEEYRRKLAVKDFEDVSSIQTESIIDPFADKQRYLRNDQGNGYIFADLTVGRFRYCPQAKGWYAYQSGKWESDMGDTAVRESAKAMSNYLFNFISKASDEERGAYEKNAKQLYGLAARERMLIDARSVNPLRLEDLDTNPDLFNVQNGTLNLRTGKIKAHSSADMISKKAGVSFMHDVDCPLWKKTLAEIFVDAPELVRYLQKVLGYALLGNPVEKQFFILYGASTNNGKSTITQTIERLFGDYAVNAPPEVIAEKRFKDSSRPSGDRARLAGVRFVSINEPERDMELDEAYVKAVTGRDTQTARHLHQSEIQYQVQFIMLIGTNHLPQVSDQTLFTSGRVRVIPIERSFTEQEQDKTLVNRLRQSQELSGILNWVLEGLTAYRQEGLRPPQAVEAATEEYRLKGDKMARFMKECTERDANSSVPASTLHAAFSAWCCEEGIRTMSINSFSTALKERKYDVAKRRINGSAPLSYVFGVKSTLSGA